jgi:hypothetical protein
MSASTVIIENSFVSGTDQIYVYADLTMNINLITLFDSYIVIKTNPLPFSARISARILFYNHLISKILKHTKRIYRNRSHENRRHTRFDEITNLTL